MSCATHYYVQGPKMYAMTYDPLLWRYFRCVLARNYRWIEHAGRAIIHYSYMCMRAVTSLHLGWYIDSSFFGHPLQESINAGKVPQNIPRPTLPKNQFDIKRYFWKLAINLAFWVRTFNVMWHVNPLHR
jgi:hypothetical protein